MTEDQKEYLSGELLRLFREEKRAKLGRRYCLPPQFQGKQMWDDAAELCASFGATPREFVQAAFDGCLIKEGPQPTHLKSKKAMGRWWRDFTNNRPAAGTACESQIVKFSEIIPGNLDWRSKAATTEGLELLRSNSVSFPEWFRVVVRPDDYQIWNEFGWVAVKQLLQQPRLVNELREKGFNVDQIMNHVDIPKPPIWVQQLREAGENMEEYEY